MRKFKTITKNLLSLTFAEMGSKGLAFITSLFLLANKLGADGNGVYTWSFSLVTLFIAITVFGLDYVGIREVAKDKSKTVKTVNLIVSIRFYLSLISYLVALIALYLLKIDSEKIIAVAIFGITLFTNAFTLDWVYKAKEQMEILALRQFLTGLFNFIGVFLFISNRNDLILAVSLYSATNLINSLWMYIYYYKSHGKITLIFSANELISTIKETYQTALFHFISVFYNYSGAFFITTLYKSDLETGLYGAAFKLFTFAMLFSGIIQSVFYPQIASAETNDSRKVILKKYSSLLFLTAGIFCIGIFLFIDDVFSQLMIASYQSSIILVQGLMFVALLAFYNVFLSQPLIAWKYERYSLRAILIGGISNLISSFIFIPFFGAKGALIAFFISELSVFLTLSHYLYRVIGSIFLTHFIKTIGIGVVIGCAIFLLQSYNINVFINMTLFVCLYGILGLYINSIKFNELKKLLIK